jgi:hypothetical protein
MKRPASVLTLTLLALGLIGCASPHASLDPNGAYSASAYYQIGGGVLYGWDGSAWYALRTPQFDRGSIGGSGVSSAECWIKVGGDRNQCYMRTGSSFEDNSVPPVFVPY